MRQHFTLGSLSAQDLAPLVTCGGSVVPYAVSHAKLSSEPVPPYNHGAESLNWDFLNESAPTAPPPSSETPSDDPESVAQ